MNSDQKKHWENIYKTKEHKKVGWYQEYPEISLKLLSKTHSTPAQSIIDIGCGASLLVDNLILQGYTDITLLDLSEAALSSVKLRLGDKGNIPKYLCKDISNDLLLPKQFDIWHDRAVFHFLTDAGKRNAYMSNLEKWLSEFGHANIGTFSLNGPNKCSGLDVVQYDAEKMKLELPIELELLETMASTHVMPSSDEQEYMYFTIKHKNAK